MKKVNINFIPQNIAPVGAKKIAIFDSNGNKVDSLPLGNLFSKSSGSKLYSFGALSDVHLPYATQHASSDFQKALTYFNNVAHVDFICIAGDISDTGTEAEWLDYKNHVDTYSPNIPVHMCTGNHDTADDITYEYPIQYTGHPLWYSFTQGDDVFIFFGLRKWQGNDVFYDEALQWLYETLEENKDKRCFVFQHEMRLDGCGNAHGLYGWDGLAGKNGQVFLSLMEHYKNVIWFHGHSHTPFRLQSVQPTPIANYDRLHGCHSVHIPSLAIPRYGNSDVIFDAEGYIVDVYENGVHLRGIDFIEEEFVPIASYWIDTTPVEIKANTYEDSTGTITKPAITLPEGSELIMNQRYSYSGNGMVTESATSTMFTVIMPVVSNSDYVVSIKNSNIALTSASGSVIYGLNSNKLPVEKINGGAIPSMSTGITLSEDGKSADIEFTTSSNTAYVALSLTAIVSGTLTENDIIDYIISLEKVKNDEGEIPDINDDIIEGFSTDLLDICDIQLNKRWSSSSKAYVEKDGVLSFSVPFSDINGRTIKIIGFESENNGVSTWYACNAQGATIGRIADGSAGVVWTSSALINNGDGSYDLPISKEIFMASGTQNPLTTTPTTIYITMHVQEVILESIDGLSMLISDNDELQETETLPEGSEVYLNQQYSQSGGGFVDRSGYIAVIMPVESSSNYTLSISNMPNANLNGQASTLYNLDVDKLNAKTINNSKYIYQMSGVTLSEDYKSATINFNTAFDTKYIVFTTVVPSLDDIIITLVKNGETTSEPINLPEGTELYLNQRYSQSGGGLADTIGDFTLIMPIDDNDKIYTVTIDNFTVDYITDASSTLYMLNSSLDCLGTVNGSNALELMNHGVTVIDNNTVQIEFTPITGTAKAALSISSYKLETTTLNEKDLSDIIITLESKDISSVNTTAANEITDTVTWTANTRLSSSDGSYKEQAGCYASSDIPCTIGDVIRIYGVSGWTAFSYICTYLSDSTRVNMVDMSTYDTGSVFTSCFDASIDENNVLAITVRDSHVAYIRVCNNMNSINNIRISVNMELE